MSGDYAKVGCTVAATRKREKVERSKEWGGVYAF